MGEIERIRAELAELADLPEEASYCEDCKGSGDIGGGFECSYCNEADIAYRNGLRRRLAAITTTEPSA